MRASILGALHSPQTLGMAFSHSPLSYPVKGEERKYRKAGLRVVPEGLFVFRVELVRQFHHIAVVDGRFQGTDLLIHYDPKIP